MAKIKGLEIKKIVEFKGHEGEPLFQCDVYYKGKKVGYFSQDFRGGMEDVEVTKEVKQLFSDYEATPTEGHEEYRFTGIEWAIYDLYALNGIEKRYKSNLKKGYYSTVFVDINPWQQSSVGVGKGFAPTEHLIDRLKTTYKDFKDLPTKAFHIYDNAKQFIID